MSGSGPTAVEVVEVDVVVIGGGPAGATAACHLARDGWSVQLVDPLGIGGALINVEHLPDHPGFPDGVAGWDLAAALGEQALAAGAAVTMGRADGVVEPDGNGPGPARWLVPVPDAGVTLRARAVLVATGCRPRPLPGDDGSLEGRGLSYCAACDGGLFAGQPVVVVGDGPVAFAEALSLAPVVAGVTIVAGPGGPRAGRAWLDAVAGLPTVTVLTGPTMTGVVLDDAGRVTGITIRGTADGGAAASGAAPDDAVPAGGGPVIPARAVFGALDPVPNSEPVEALISLASDRRVPVDPTYAVPGVGRPGLFAAGDVRAGAALRAVAAAGDGAGAAVAISSYLRG